MSYQETGYFITPLTIATQLTQIDVISSTTLVNTDLTFPVAANHVYSFQTVINYDGGFTGDYDATFIVPSGTAGGWAVGTIATIAFATRVKFSASGAGVRRQLLANGNLVTGSTSGTLLHQFSQDEVEAVDTSILAGSMMMLWDGGAA